MWVAYRGADGWYVAFETSDGKRYHSRGGMTEKEAKALAKELNSMG